MKHIEHAQYISIPTYSIYEVSKCNKDVSGAMEGGKGFYVHSKPFRVHLFVVSKKAREKTMDVIDCRMSSKLKDPIMLFCFGNKEVLTDGQEYFVYPPLGVFEKLTTDLSSMRTTDLDQLKLSRFFCCGLIFKRLLGILPMFMYRTHCMMRILLRMLLIMRIIIFLSFLMPEYRL